MPRRRFVAASAGCTGGLLTGCAAPEKASEAPVVVPVFPAPPDPPRFVFERSIRSSADVVREDSNAELRRWVTGESRRGQTLGKPYGVAVRRGRVYVTDTVRRSIVLFDYARAAFVEFGIRDPGGTRLPIGIDTDAAGRVYVIDGASRIIHVYEPDGAHLRMIDASAQVQRAAGLAVDAAGDRVYAVDIGGVDSERHGVHVFDALDGRHLRSIGRRGTGPGEFNLPRDVAVDPAGRLFVVDGGNFRIQVLEPDGRPIRIFGSVGRQSGMFSRPKELAIDRGGRVYVVDAAFGNMQIFDADGRLLLDIGARSRSDRPAGFMLPSGIAVDEDGRVFMVDQYFRRIDVFRPVSLPVEQGYLGSFADRSAEVRARRRKSR